MKQMADVFASHRSSVIGVLDVPPADTRSYGIVKSSRLTDTLERIAAIVEKPMPEKAPSTLGVVGRYILTPRIFHHLENVKPGAGGEIQLTDGTASLLSEEAILACRYDGIRYDCGSAWLLAGNRRIRSPPSRSRRGFHELSQTLGLVTRTG